MKHLLAHLKKYKLESVLGPLFKLLEASFELMIPLVVASIVEDGIKGENVAHIIKMCLILVLLAVVGLASSLTAQYFAAKAAVGTATGLRKAFVHTDGQARHVYHDHKDHERSEPGTVRNQPDPQTLFALTVHRFRCGDHGIHRRSPVHTCFCGCNSPALRCGIRNYGAWRTALQKSAGRS